MSAQDDQDWLDLLAGKSVPDAAPNTVREARIFRAALLTYADKEKVGKVKESYPPILAKVLNRLETEGYLQKPQAPKVSKPKAPFQQYDSLFSLAASLLIAVLIVVLQIPVVPPLIPVPPEKSPEPCVNERVEPQPRRQVIRFQQELKSLGIASEIKKLDNGWRLKATLPTDKSPALLKLLARYEHLIVLPKSQYLCVNILAKETQ